MWPVQEAVAELAKKEKPPTTIEKQKPSTETPKARYDVDGNLLEEVAAKPIEVKEIKPEPTVQPEPITKADADPTAEQVHDSKAFIEKNFLLDEEVKIEAEQATTQREKPVESAPKPVRLPIVRKVEDYVIRPNEEPELNQSNPLITVLSQSDNPVRDVPHQNSLDKRMWSW